METKICKTCLIEKPLNEFYRHRRYKDGYLPHCIECEKQKRLVNREKILESRKNSYARNKDVINKRRKENYDSVKDKISEYHRNHYLLNREKIIEKSKDWALNNKAKVNNIQQRRRIKKKSALIKSLTDDDLKQIELFYEIARWMTEVFEEPFHVDHIIPLQHEMVCGLHVPWNLQVLFASENLTKSNKFEIEI